MKFSKTLTIASCLAAALCSPSFAQETAVEAKSEAATTVATSEDGSLTGKVFAEKDGVQTPLSAKVTLSSEGVVVDSVEAKEDGSFSFADIGPGSYQIIGSADGYIGGQAYDVQPFASDIVSSGGCSSCNVGMEAVEAPCSSCSQSLYQAPASACGCGGGGGIGGGGGLLGGGGGLNFRRLALIGGVTGLAIAVSDDDDDDMVSPDN